ncbi:MAG: protein kinase [Gemmatimonadetes bacterium]|nr:protein kinase [Gemmatimonadota bacterium]
MFCPACGTWNRASAAACARCAAAMPDDVERAGERPDDEITRLRSALGARYRVLRRLGGGGMASVYMAEHSALERSVVIKVLHAHLSRDPEMLERFRREARAASALVHPHICPVLDFGEGEGIVWTTMPFLAGGSLADQLVRDRTVNPDVAAAAAAQVATALDYAHRRGIVHRDIKPDNVLFDDDGHALLTDFGIATARADSRLTASGRAMGTPHYMSPEQAMGRLVDGRSDLYAVGVLLYEVLVGLPPFDGADAFSVGYKQVHERPVPPETVNSRVPADLSAIVMCCLEKAPADRYQTGNQLADALLSYLAHADTTPDIRRSAQVARLAITTPQ